MSGKLPPEVYDFMATLKDVPPVVDAPAKRSRQPEKLARCADCRKERDLVQYGLKAVCRKCAADRDRLNGLVVKGREWA